MNILISLIAFILAIGILTIVHELGHFWVARKMGVKVPRFSIGFGKILFSLHDKYGTEYAISAWPFGAYVSMLDEITEPVADSEKMMALSSKSIPARMAIVCAGPAFNLLFAILAYWLVFMLGVATIVPVLGTVPKGTIADLAGLKPGQEIVAIDGRVINTWEDVRIALMAHIGEKGVANFLVRDIDTKIESRHIANLDTWVIDSKNSEILQALGLEPFDPVLPIVDTLLAGYPASASGLQRGDHIVYLDKQKISSQTELQRYIRGKAGQPVVVGYKRNNIVHETHITPVKKLLDGGEEVGFIGISFQAGAYPKNLIRLEKFGVLAAGTHAISKTKDYTILTANFLYKMVVGKVSLEYISGPISIAKYSGQTIQISLQVFLSFLALVSISLGVFNMLPIPMLDGGAMLLLMLESITGKKISKHANLIWLGLGKYCIASLLILAIYNDCVRLLL